MRDEGLISMDVDLHTSDVVVVYEPDAPYEVGEIIAYVEDMCQGKTSSVLIYEGTHLIWQLARIPNGQSWADVAGKTDFVLH
jgi:hypothetical protein